MKTINDLGKRRLRVGLVTTLAAVVAMMPVAALAGSVDRHGVGVTKLVSKSTAGKPSNKGAHGGAVSADGRWVAFISWSKNLSDEAGCGQPGWQNSCIYLRDQHTHETTMVSRSVDGEGAFGDYEPPSITADGQLVVYVSQANDLVADDDNGARDVFVYDRTTGETTLVSRNPAGRPANASASAADVSPDGRFIVYESYATDLLEDGSIKDTNGQPDVFRFDRSTGETTVVSVRPDGELAVSGAHRPSVDASGRFIAFDSDSPDLVRGDRNAESDIFVRDVVSGKTTLVSKTEDGEQGNDYSSGAQISDDASVIAFSSSASNFAAHDVNVYPDVFSVERESGVVTTVDLTPEGSTPRFGALNGLVSADGNLIIFDSISDDAPGGGVFSLEMTTGELSVITREGHGSDVSADGTWVVFDSFYGASANDEAPLYQEGQVWLQRRA